VVDWGIQKEGGYKEEHKMLPAPMNEWLWFGLQGDALEWNLEILYSGSESFGGG